MSSFFAVPWLAFVLAIPSTEGIDKAIQELGANKFAVRERASQTLWEFGLAAQPALEKAAKSDDAEVRSRAQRILRDFQYGVLPGVPGDVVKLIRDFRDGDLPVRQRALQQLAADKYFATVERLIQLEPSAEVRRESLVALFQNEQAVEHFVDGDGDRLTKLVNAVAIDADDNWKRNVLAQMLFSDKVVQRLAMKNRLGVLLAFIDKEQSAEVRTTMLGFLFNNQAAINSLVLQDGLSFLFKAVAAVPDKPTRGNWLRQILYNQEAVKQLGDEKRLESLLDFVQKELDAKERGEVYVVLFQHQNVLEKYLDKQGLDGIVTLATGEKDASTRGRLLGAILASQPVQRRLAEKKQYALAIKLIRDEQDADARGVALQQVMQSGVRGYLLADAESRKAIWLLLKEGQGAWRAGVLLVVIQQQPDEWLKEKADTEWLLKFFGDDANPDQRTQFLQMLSYNQLLMRRMFEHDRFDTLLAMIRGLPENNRRQVFAGLFSNWELAQRLAEKKQLPRLVAFAKDETDLGSRAQFLEALFRNGNAMQALIKDGHHDALVTLIKADTDAERRAQLYGDFYGASQAVVQMLTEKKQLVVILQLARDEANLDVRRQYLARLYMQHFGLAALVADHFDELFQFATADAASRKEVLPKFYMHQAVLDRFVKQKKIDVVLKYVQDEVEPQMRPQIAQRMFYTPAVLDALVDQGHFDALKALTERPEMQPYRPSLLSNLFANASVIQGLVKRNQTTKLFDWIRDSDDNTRRNVLSQLTQRADTSKLLIEKDHLDDLLKLIGDERNPPSRGQFLAYLFGQAATVEALAKQKKLDLILDTARQEDASAKTQFAQIFVYQYNGHAAMLDQGRFDDLVALVSLGDENSRPARVTQFLVNPKTIEHLVAKKKLDMLTGLVRNQNDAAIRRQVLNALLASQPAVNALLQHNQFDDLWTICRADEDASSRRQSLAALTANPLVIERLSKTERLGEVLTELLAEKDANTRRQLLQRIFGRFDVVNSLVEQGQFEVVFKTIDEETDKAQRAVWLGSLMYSAKALDRLVKDGKVAMLFQSLSEDADQNRRANTLTTLVQRPDTLRVLIEAKLFGELLTLVREKTQNPQRENLLTSLLVQTPALGDARDATADSIVDELRPNEDENRRRQFIATLIYNANARQLLARPKVAELLLKALQAEPEATRTSYVRYFLTSNSWQSLVASNQIKIIDEIIKLENDEPTRRSAQQRVLFDPTGRLPQLLRAGKFDESVELLDQHATDDMGRLRLASSLLAMGRLDARIADVQQRTADTPKPEDLRLLTYLLRAKGDLAGARAVAEKIGEDGLIKSIALEQRDWAAAARLQAAGPCPLPIPTVAPSKEQTHQRIEQLGLVAAYSRLAGQTDDYTKAMNDIEQMASLFPTDANLQWYCVEALFLNDRPVQAMKVLAGSNPPRAFDMHVFRQEYARAFEIANWKPDTEPNKAWLDSLSVRGASDDIKANERLQFAMRVARLLKNCGKKDIAAKIVDLVESEVAARPATANVSPNPRQQSYETFAVELLRIDEEQRAWEAAAKALPSPQAMSNVLYRLHPQRQNEAVGWWYAVQTQFKSDPPASLFARVHRVMNRRGDESDDEFAQLAAAAIKAAESLPVGDSRRDAIRVAVATTAQRRGQLEIAAAAVESAKNAELLLGDIQFKRERFAEAAKAYEAAWKAHMLPAALYLQGESLERAGDAASGRTAKEQATLSVIHSVARRMLAAELLARGLKDAAAEQYRLVLRTAPCEHWEWHESVRILGEQLDYANREEAATLMDMARLDDLRLNFYLLTMEDYLRSAANIHEARGEVAIAAGDWARAEREFDIVWAATPGSTRFVERVVPQCEKKGGQELADRLFDRFWKDYTALIDAHPDHATLRNNVAWVASKCGRRLEDALRHSERAVALSPANAGFLDTLAETHFRLGHRDQAVKTAEAALALRPTDDYYQRQLKRFREE